MFTNKHINIIYCIIIVTKVLRKKKQYEAREIKKNIPAKETQTEVFVFFSFILSFLCGLVCMLVFFCMSL